MRVGFIGLGMMGKGMAANLQKAGHQLVVHDLSRAAAEPVKGALAARRPLAHRLPQLERLDHGLDSHRKDLGKRHAHDRTGAVVHELGDRTRADRAE